MRMKLAFDLVVPKKPARKGAGVCQELQGALTGLKGEKRARKLTRKGAREKTRSGKL
jgi:hypothetical protein